MSTTAREEALSFLSSIENYQVDATESSSTATKDLPTTNTPDDVLKFLDNVADSSYSAPPPPSTSQHSKVDEIPSNKTSEESPELPQREKTDLQEAPPADATSQSSSGWGLGWSGIWSDASKVVKSARALQQDLEQKASVLVRSSENSVKTFLKNKNIEKLGQDIKQGVNSVLETVAPPIPDIHLTSYERLQLFVEVFVTYEDRSPVSELLAACCHDAIECALSNWESGGNWVAMGNLDFEINCVPSKTVSSSGVANNLKEATLFVKDAVNALKKEASKLDTSKTPSQQRLFVGFHPYKAELEGNSLIQYYLLVESDTALHLHDPTELAEPAPPSSLSPQINEAPLLLTLTQSIPEAEWVERTKTLSDSNIRRKIHKKDVQVEAWKKERWNRVLGGALRDAVEGFVLKWFIPVKRLAASNPDEKSDVVPKDSKEIPAAKAIESIKGT